MTQESAVILGSDGAPAKHEPREVGSLDQFIMRAASDPSFDVQKFAALLDLQRQHQAAQREQAFHDALSRVQAQMPQIDQSGLINYGEGKGKIPYAKLEDIDAIIRPIYTAEGFSVRVNSRPVLDGKQVEFSATFSAHGHKEVLTISLPPDTSGGKNACQAVPSALKYAERHLLKMFFNVIERGKDLDGAKIADLKPITQEQADDIRSALQETGSNVAKFLGIFKVSKLEEIRVGQLKEVWAQIDRKRGVK